MERSRFTEEQVSYTLKLAEQGTPVKEVCRQFGIAEATFYVRMCWLSRQSTEVMDPGQGDPGATSAI